MLRINLKCCYAALMLMLYAASPICLADGNKQAKSAKPVPQPTLHGYCPVSYFTENQAIKGDPAYQSRYLGEVYFFVSERTKKVFDADPERYLPQFAGWGTLTLGGPYGKRIPGDPEVFTVADGKLYLFVSERAKRAYETHMEAVLMKAPHMFAKPHIFGYSPVAYQKQNKAEKGNPKFHAVYQRQMYFLGSEVDRRLFVKSPEQYAPQYSGYCAMSLAKGSRYYADPNFFAVVNHKTYLFINQEMKDSFMLNPTKAAAAADILWIGIQGDSTQ